MIEPISKIQDHRIFFTIFPGVCARVCGVYICVRAHVRKSEREREGVYVCIRFCESKQMVEKCMKECEYKPDYV